MQLTQRRTRALQPDDAAHALPHFVPRQRRAARHLAGHEHLAEEALVGGPKLGADLRGTAYIHERVYYHQACGHSRNS